MVEWEGGRVSDMVADAVIAVLLQAGAGADGLAGGSSAGGLAALDSAEAAFKKARDAGDMTAAAAAELNAVAALVGAQFGPALVDDEAGAVHVDVGGSRQLLHHKQAGSASGLQGSRAEGQHAGAEGGGGLDGEAVPAPPPGVPATIYLSSGSGGAGAKVVCEDGHVRLRLEKAVRRLLEAMRPVCTEL
jgi:hypothetical protein